MERVMVVLGVAAALAVVAALLAWRDRRLRARLRLPPGPAVIAFTHRLCTPCRTQQLPALRRVQAAVGPGLRVDVVDVERDPATARRFGIFTVPSTVVVGPDGRVVAFNHGFADEGRLLHQLATSRASEPQAVRAGA